MKPEAPSAGTRAQLFLARALRRTTPYGTEDDPFASPFLRGNPRLSPAEQLEIYREQFWLRHEEALREDFPALATYLGERRFTRVVEVCLDEEALASFSLTELGRAVPRALAGPETAEALEVEGPELERLRELADLEWAFVEVFHEADSPVLEPTMLEALPPESWETARLELRAGLRLLRFRNPVHDWRRSLVSEGASAALPDSGPVCLALYRAADFVLYDKVLAEPALALLERLREGATLLDACETVAARSLESRRALEENLTRWFAEFTRLGFFAGLRWKEGNPP